MVLYDASARKSFVSPTFYALFVLPRSPLSSFLDKEVMVGDSVLVQEKTDRCSIVKSDHTFPLTLITIGITSFDFIIGVDWFFVNQAKILFAEKHICIPLVEGGHVIVHGQKSLGCILIIYMMKARKQLETSCEVFLDYVVESTRKIMELTDI